MHTITIIGTHPPCPRCSLLTLVFADKIKQMKLDAELIHLGFKDKEAIDIAEKFGLKPGTSGMVAQIIQKPMDPTRKFEPDDELINNEEYSNYLTNWSFELDESLREYELKAREVGILMTPTVIINGELKHSGSVPRLAIIEKWLEELM